MVVDNVLQVLGNARRPVHHKMSVRKQSVNLNDSVHGKHIAIRFSAEFVRTVASPDSDRKRVNACSLDKFHRLLGISEELIVRQYTFRTVPVFFLALTRLKRTETAKFAFNGNTVCMCHLDNLPRHLNVVFKIRGCFSILYQ